MEIAGPEAAETDAWIDWVPSFLRPKPGTATERNLIESPAVNFLFKKDSAKRMYAKVSGILFATHATQDNVWEVINRTTEGKANWSDDDMDRLANRICQWFITNFPPDPATNKKWKTVPLKMQKDGQVLWHEIYFFDESMDQDKPAVLLQLYKDKLVVQQSSVGIALAMQAKAYAVAVQPPPAPAAAPTPASTKACMRCGKKILY